MKIIFNVFFVIFTLNASLARNNSITFISQNADMLIDVNKSGNRLYVYDHIINASSTYIRINASLYENDFGDQINWRSNKLIDFRPKRWRNFVTLEVVRNADIVIEVKKRRRVIPQPQINSRNSFIEEVTNLSILEGTWVSENPEKSLVLLATRDGFKVKFTGSNRWVDFYTTDQPNVFKDERDNSYHFNSYKDATWQSKDNGWSVDIKKVSSEFKY